MSAEFVHLHNHSDYSLLDGAAPIRALVDKLDGGGRQSVVIQLDALDARSVARTIDFMMGGGREEQQPEEESQDQGGFDPFRGIFSRRSRSRDRSQSQERGDRPTRGMDLLGGPGLAFRQTARSRLRTWAIRRSPCQDRLRVCWDRLLTRIDPTREGDGGR